MSARSPHVSRRPDFDLGSYDRFFPSQDTIARGGFGNLIALPLQKEARQGGNSVFLDQNLVPHVDQWSFLATVQKISVRRVEDVVSVEERQGRVVGIRLVVLEEEDQTPWKIPPSRRRKAPAIIGTLPASLELVLANEIFISKAALPPALRYRLLCLAAFQNPGFYKAQAMRFPDQQIHVLCRVDVLPNRED